MKAKIAEIIEELRTVLAGRTQWLDSLLPLLAFLIINPFWGFTYAAWASLILALLICVARVSRGQPWKYALGGVGGVLLAIFLARLWDREGGFFLPGIFTAALTVLLCGVSLLFGRPLVAWSSYLARRWPLEWYWHPQVRPAYSEVTAAWLLFFLLRLLPQLFLLGQEQATLLGLFQLLSGWPATLILLVLSYLYGSWRLRQLAGPSVAEFKAGAPPPWESQRRGF